MCDDGFGETPKRTRGPADGGRGCSQGYHISPFQDFGHPPFCLHNRDLNTDLFRGKTYGKVLHSAPKTTFIFITSSPTAI